MSAIEWGIRREAIARVRQLEAERNKALAEAKRLRAIVAAVERLHTPRTDGPNRDLVCEGCQDDCLYCEGEHVWPCGTIDAIHEASV